MAAAGELELAASTIWSRYRRWEVSIGNSESCYWVSTFGQITEEGFGYRKKFQECLPWLSLKRCWDRAGSRQV